MSKRMAAAGAGLAFWACVTSSARAQPDAPGDKEIAATIARGVAFLKEAQSPAGHWDEPAQNDHRLGMTALAGLALMENGVVRERLRSVGHARLLPSWRRRPIKRTTLRWRSCFWRGASKGGAAMQMCLSARSDSGSQGEIAKEYGIIRCRVSNQRQRLRPAGRAVPGGGERPGDGSFSRVKATTQTRSSRYWVCGRQAGTAMTPTRCSRRSMATSGRLSSVMAAGVIGSE